MHLRLIDALGTLVDEKHPPHNWSVAPLYDQEDIRDHEDRILERFEEFVARVKAIGYNAVSLDDLPHFVSLDIYSEGLQEKLAHYRRLYRELCHIAERHEMRVFVNFDIMYFNREIERATRGRHRRIIRLLRHSLETLFDEYPAVAGIITRIGESDGLDVESLWKSRLTIKNARQARLYLKKLLPLFEERGKTWVFRTWSVGAYKIGDIIWNKKTFQDTFGGIRSDSLVISIKYGESDFFRNLDLNPLFETHGHHLIIELQAKREYDGFGELPFYTGWDYEQYYEKLRGNPHLIGIYVWCQTGGWRKSDRITFLHRSSSWVELNAVSTLRIFQGVSADQCVRDFFPGNPAMLGYLRRYAEISKEIMYEDSEPKLYFRKTRIPPLLWIFWDHITINSFIKAYFAFILDDRVDVTDKDIRELSFLGRDAQIPDNAFVTATLRILFACRMALEDKLSLSELRRQVAVYDRDYPGFFTFSISATLDTKRLGVIALRSVFRHDGRYRLIDRALWNRFYLLPLVRLFLALHKKYLPGFVGNQAMPLTTLFK